MEVTELSKLAASVSTEFVDKSSKITEFRVTSSIISLDKFYETFNSQVHEKAARLPAFEHVSSTEDFAAIFKSFEYYPENIKPKKVAKELSRVNSTILSNCTATSSISENVTLPVEQPSCSAQTLLTNVGLENPESAKTILKKYEQFKFNLVKLLERAERQVTLATEYATMLQQINVFAQQLEKLLPSHGMEKRAFNSEEQLKLEMIVADMKRLNFLQSNRDIFNNVNGTDSTINSSSHRLEGLVDVLAHSLNSISCYNEF